MIKLIKNNLKSVIHQNISIKVDDDIFYLTTKFDKDKIYPLNLDDLADIKTVYYNVRINIPINVLFLDIRLHIANDYMWIYDNKNKQKILSALK